ncbi:MAG: DUF371 domain-containing protein [Methanobacteriota archaeon]|nr:MAG: DUF371 domain-containing protein [Euryarchaeota archaeon]
MYAFEITCYGHPNVTASHRTTWELTKENHLTPKGDCIIGINASSSPLELPKILKQHLQSGGEIKIVLEIEGEVFEGWAFGHPDLLLSHPKEMVFRTSDFVSERTVAIKCSFAAKDIPREMVELMKDPSTQMVVRLSWKPMDVSA